MNPQDRVPDLMRRTMMNLRFIEEQKQQNGPFEVTQLVNSFLGALAHPWEQFRSELDRLSLPDAEQDGWPHLANERSEDQPPHRPGNSGSATVFGTPFCGSNSETRPARSPASSETSGYRGLTGRNCLCGKMLRRPTGNMGRDHEAVAG